jgi:pyruvate kinase
MRKILIGLLTLSSISAFAETRIQRMSGDNMQITNKTNCRATITQKRDYNSSSFKLSLSEGQCISLNEGDMIKEVVLVTNGNGIHTAIEVSKIITENQSGLSIVSILKD